MQIQKQIQVRKKIKVLMQIKLQVVTVLLEEPNKLYIQDIRKGLQVTTFGDIGCLFRYSPFPFMHVTIFFYYWLVLHVSGRQ